MNSFEFTQSSFGESPKSFNAVDVRFAPNELIFRMIHPIMFFESEVDQPVVRTPTVGMDCRVERYLPANNRLQSSTRASRHNLCVNFPTSFEQSENRNFFACAATSFPADSFWSKIRFVDLDLASDERRFFFALLEDPFANLFENFIDRVDVLETPPLFTDPIPLICKYESSQKYSAHPYPAEKSLARSLQTKSHSDSARAKIPRQSTDDLQNSPAGATAGISAAEEC